MPIYNENLFKNNRKLLLGNLQIIACAGSGKTEFVSERIAFQIKEKIARPEQIVAFTFTDKAAEELKFRVRLKIKELLGHQPDMGDIFIGTIHSFAFKLLQEFVPKYKSYDMLDGNSQLAFLSSMKYDLNLNHMAGSLTKRGHRKSYGQTKEAWVLSTLVKDANIFREEGLSPEDAVSDSFRNAYKEYLDQLEKKKFIDFSGVLFLVVKNLLKKKDVLRKVRDQFKFFTVDEYQDVNPIQEKLIQLVSNQENVCVVGDDDQSIYQWRGADVNNIISFKKSYKDATIHEITVNRRSTEKIIQTADLFIKQNPKRIPKEIKHSEKIAERGDLYKLEFKKQEEEIEWILNKINSLHGTEFKDGSTIRGLKYSDMAILFRTNKEAEEYVKALKEDEIPVIFNGTGGLTQISEIQFIMSILKYISEFDTDTKNEDFLKGQITNEIKLLFSSTKKVKFLNDLKEIKNSYSDKKRISLQELFVEILSLLGIANSNLHQMNEPLLYNLGKFSQAISDFESTRDYVSFNNIKNFIWFLILHGEKNYSSGEADSLAGLVDAVQVMTMHGTKGLGFPVVFLPSHLGREKDAEFGSTFIDQERVDLSRFLNKPEDERRLYYVAITRAKKYLFITTPTIKVGGSRKSQKKSIYEKIPITHFITEDTKDPTKRKKSKEMGMNEDLILPTNYSELAYFLKCGYDYKMRFLFGFNPMLVPALGFGKEVHNLINLLHKNYLDTRKTPTSENLQTLIDYHFYLRYASQNIFQTFKESARRSLDNYLKMFQKDFELSIKTERAFEFEMEGSLVSGATDLLKRSENNSDTLELIDFKTGKPDNDLKEKYELQVQLYTLALQESLSMNIKEAFIHYLDKKENKRESVHVDVKSLEKSRKTIQSAINGIKKSDFQMNPKSEKVCSECDWCKMCPKK
jgi:DNA helicase II / ATP-dependent DNA helicase PcrA